MIGPLVKNPDDIRLALVGIVEENAHPYSWSAILNGYDPEGLGACPEPIVRRYLAAEPAENFGIPGARVTHIWGEDARETLKVAQASRIPFLASSPEEVIGEVDAVLIPTDIGCEHLERARPFVEAGLPVFIDKPLTDRADHLRQFAKWHREGRSIFSCSCMRFAREFAASRERLGELGQLRLITMTMAKDLERYGIHAAEAVYPFLPCGGWVGVRCNGTSVRTLVEIEHASGVCVILVVIEDLLGAMGCLSLYGTEGWLTARFQDSFFAFKRQLEAFVSFLRTGISPFPFEETLELTQIVIAAVLSREAQGRRVLLSEVSV